ncbi:TKL protein kinase [Plasmodium inui San Antonio 1]|uniref:TKL protein kinase n=1 Tax=Plasmodium inui San Antonio 1 TaxID=1237626 RepID=W7ASY7_9APIC|nr:TKL protein kinase [Plasmodium inui San Antonio 1]EUD68551.1 TKL protein kinase [Plasmodium inui San Antonio 1]
MFKGSSNKMKEHSFYGNANKQELTDHHPKSASNVNSVNGVFYNNIISRQEFNKDFLRSGNFLEEENLNEGMSGLSKGRSGNNSMVYVNSHGEIVPLDYSGDAAHRGINGQKYSGHVNGHVNGHVSSHVNGHVSNHVNDHVNDHVSNHVSDHVSRPSFNGGNVFKEIPHSQAEYIHADLFGDQSSIHNSPSLSNRYPMNKPPTNNCNVSANEIINKRLFINNLIEIKEKLNNIKRERLEYEKEDEAKEEEENNKYMAHLKSYDKMKNSYSLTNLTKMQDNIMNKMNAEEERKKMPYNNFFENDAADVNYPGGRPSHPSQQKQQYVKFEKRKSAEQRDEERNYVFYDLKQYLGENHRQKGYSAVNGSYERKQGEKLSDRLGEKLNDPLHDRKYDRYLDRKSDKLHDRQFEKFFVREEDQEEEQKGKQQKEKQQSSYEHLQKMERRGVSRAHENMMMMLEQESLHNAMQKLPSASKVLYTHNLKGLKVIDNVKCCPPAEDANVNGKRNIPTMIYLGGSFPSPGVAPIGGDPCGNVFHDRNAYDVRTSLYLNKGLRDEDNLKKMLSATTKKVLNCEEQNYRLPTLKGHELYESKKNGAGAGCIQNGASPAFIENGTGAQISTTSMPLKNETENYVGKNCSCANYGKKKGVATAAAEAAVVGESNCGGHLKKGTGKSEQNGKMSEQVKGSGGGVTPDVLVENHKRDKNVCRKNSVASMSNNFNLNVSETDLNGNKNSSEKRNSYDNNNGVANCNGRNGNSGNNVDKTVAYFKENCLSNENVVYDEEKKIFKTKENCNIKIYRRSLEREKMLNFPLIHLGENDVLVKRIKLYYPLRNENIFTNISKIIFMTNTNICSLYLSDTYLIHYDDVKIQSYLSKGGFGVVYKGVLLRNVKKCELMYGASGKYRKMLSNQKSSKGLGGGSGVDDEAGGRAEGRRSTHRQLNQQGDDTDDDEDEEEYGQEKHLGEQRDDLHAGDEDNYVDGVNQDSSSNYADNNNSNVQDGAESKGNSGHGSEPNGSTPKSSSPPKASCPNKQFPMKKKKSHNSDSSKLSRSTKKLCNLRNQLIEKIFDTFRNPISSNGGGNGSGNGSGTVGGNGMNGEHPVRGAETGQVREKRPGEEEEDADEEDEEKENNYAIENILKSWDKANQQRKKKASNHEDYNVKKEAEGMFLRKYHKSSSGNVHGGEGAEDDEEGAAAEDGADEKMDLKKGSNCIHVQEIRKLKKKMLNFIYSKKTSDKIIIDRDEFFIEAKKILYKLKMLNNTELGKKYHEEIIVYLLMDVYHNNVTYKNTLSFLYVKSNNIITYGVNKESLYIFDNKNIFHYYSDKCIFKIVFIDEHKELKKYQSLTVFNVLNNERMMNSSSILKYEINRHKNGLNKLAIIPFSRLNMNHLLNALIFGFLKFLFNLRKKYHKQPNNCSCYPEAKELNSNPNANGWNRTVEPEQVNQASGPNYNALFSNLKCSNTDACGGGSGAGSGGGNDGGALNFNNDDRDSMILQEKINMLDEFLCCNYEEISTDYAEGRIRMMSGGSGNNERSDETENNNGAGSGAGSGGGSGGTGHGSSGRSTGRSTGISSGLSNNMHRYEADKMGSTNKANMHLSRNGAGSITLLNTNNTDESKTTMFMNGSRNRNAFKAYGNERDYNYYGQKVSKRDAEQQHLEDVGAENSDKEEEGKEEAGEKEADEEETDEGDGEERVSHSSPRGGRKGKGTREKGLPEVKNAANMREAKAARGSRGRVDTKGVKNANVTSLSVEGKKLMKMKSGADGKGVKNATTAGVKEEADEGRNIMNESGKGGVEETCEESEEVVQVKIPVAIKIHDLKDSKNLKNFLREIEIYKNIQRPNICTFYGICIKSNKLMLLLEYYAKGNLFNYLKNKKKIHKKQRLAWASEMCYIVHGLHAHNPPIVNGDIKTSNVLIDNNMHLVMCDFGKARFKNSKLYSNFGSYRYMAPETFSCTSEVTEKIDIWSLACCIVEIFSSKYPYHNLSKNVKIRHELLINKNTPHIPNFLPNSMKKCLERCFSFTPEERPCAYEMYKCLKKIKVVE